MTTQELNVDSAEIAKFERLAARWWDLEGEFKPLHDLNPLRANYIDERAQVAEKNYSMWVAAAAFFAKPWPNAAP